MSARAALLGSAAAVGAAGAWVIVASGATLAFAGLWDHPFFAQGVGWATAWWTYASDPAARQAMPLPLLGGAAFATAGAVGAAQLAWPHLRRGPSLHGKTAFASRRAAEKGGIAFARRPRPDSIVLGRTPGFLGLGRRYLCLPGSAHVSLNAMTGSGKGVSFVVPNCLSWGGSLICFDIKGELYRKTAARRRGLGHEVYCFSPGASDGRSHRYNPYSVVPRGQAGCIDALHRYNHILIPPNPKAENPFWDNAARDAVNGISVILAETPGAPLHPGAVRRAVLRPDYRERLRAMVRAARAAGRPYPQTAVDSVLTWVDDPDDRSRSGVQRTIQTHLALWGSPTVVAATEASDFDLRAFRDRPISVYLRLRATEMRRFRPLTALLFQQMLDLNTEAEFGQSESHRCQVLMMMDEFAAMGRMDILADAAAFVRSFGIRMAYVAQTKAQLVSIYGQEGADNLFENTSAEVVFGVKGVKAAREVSDMAGFDTVSEVSKNRPRFMGWMSPARQTESEAARRRALLLPQEVQRLAPEKEIVFRPGMEPVSAERIVYHKDRFFRHLEEAPPDVPALNVTVERDDGASAP